MAPLCKENRPRKLAEGLSGLAAQKKNHAVQRGSFQPNQDAHSFVQVEGDSANSMG